MSDRRYWISISSQESASEVSGETPTKDDKAFDVCLMDLGFQPRSTYGFTELVFKTSNEIEAKKVVSQAKEYLRRYLPHVPEESVSCVTQPQCPNCNYLGRFSDWHCSECGTELLEKEYVEWD